MIPTVLVVDDSLTVRMDLADAVEAAGFRPLPCATAAAARDALSHGAVALIILDVLLPDTDGVAFLDELRNDPATAAIPVLMLSSEAEVKDRIRGLRQGADDYVGKPYDTDHVVARAEALIRERAGTSTSAQVTILVIDDSATFRQELFGALQRAGYAVLLAADGQEGLRLAAAKRPSAIIIDNVMPDIDGGTVIRRIRLDEALRGTPCVLLTASEDGDAELRALDAGADAFVRKEDDFDVVLARIAAVLRSASTRTEQAASLLAPKRILAVDDSATYLQALAATLRDEGYDVVLASSGEEALDMLAVQSVDCILLDLLMPGLSGKETCGRIKASPVLRETPLIMLTALEDRKAMIEGLGMGADDYISKSSEFEVLKARVQAQIRRKQFEDEHRRVREELLRVELEATEARAARQLAETKAALAEQLERKNKELESFSYSVSHDLRAPLRSIDGFSQALAESAAASLDDKGREHLHRIREAARRMGELIDDLLLLSHVTSAELRRDRLNLSQFARLVADELQRKEPDRKVAVVIEDELSVHADSRLIRILFENLLSNAWKFTSRTAGPQIEFGAERRDDGKAYFVRDNGVGFNMAHAARLFAPFQRLHSETDFPGTGIGLATVYRIVDRHGGRIWAEGEVGRGATVYFEIPQIPGDIT